MKINKKVLIIASNANLISKQEGSLNVGTWFGGVVDFVDVMTKSGIQVDFVTPNGGSIAFDPSSFEDDEFSLLNDRYKLNTVFMSETKNTFKPSQINYEDYLAVYFAPGYSPLLDLVNNDEINKLVLNIYNNNGYIVAVGHGVAGLLNLKNDANEYFIKNLKITGFSNQEEQEAEMQSWVPFLLEDELIKRQANYSKSTPWENYAVVDNRVITAQNALAVNKVAHGLLKQIAKQS